jgi:PAS domain-containing protein
VKSTIVIIILHGLVILLWASFYRLQCFPSWELAFYFSSSSYATVGVVLDDQLRVIFANEALARMGHFERDKIQGRTPDAIFPSEDLFPNINRYQPATRIGPPLLPPPQ